MKGILLVLIVLLPLALFPVLVTGRLPKYFDLESYLKNNPRWVVTLGSSKYGAALFSRAAGEFGAIVSSEVDTVEISWKIKVVSAMKLAIVENGTQLGEIRFVKQGNLFRGRGTLQDKTVITLVVARDSKAVMASVDGGEMVIATIAEPRHRSKIGGWKDWRRWVLVGGGAIGIFALHFFRNWAKRRDRRLMVQKRIEDRKEKST